MVMGCIGQKDVRVRSEGAGDAMRIGKPSRRRTRVFLVDPKGRVFQALGRRRVPLAMLPASQRGTLLAQDFENAVQLMTITREGS